METVHPGLVAVPAPLVVVQGIAPELRSKRQEWRQRVSQEEKYVHGGEDLHYGVQITIDRELDDVNSEGVAWIAQLINNYSVRDCVWWPREDGGSVSRTAKGVWFNVKYSDRRYEVIVNGSKSSLSPYNNNGKFYNSLLPLEWMYKYYDYIPAVFISIYEIGLDESLDDILVNEINRIKARFSNTMIKFVALVVYARPECARHVRIQSLMSRINMTSNSLFVINGGAGDTARREQAVFVRKLMVGLRQYSTDFFELQMQKLKKREMKNDLYPMSFFGCRNLIKMAIFEQMKGIDDHSTKLLEYSYDKLLQILQAKSGDTPQPAEGRQWLDILCLHIVRSCLVLGETNVAYRKFMFHLQKVKELAGNEFSFCWMSLQYTWLGELLESVHESGSGVIPVEQTLLPTVRGRNKLNSFNMPQTGFIYLQAFRYRALDVDANSDNRIQLLSGALDAFGTATTRFQRFECGVYALLGDVYRDRGNYSMAVNNYMASIGVFKRERCLFIVKCILRKVCLCYMELRRVREASAAYVELCLISGRDSVKYDDLRERLLELGVVGAEEEEEDAVALVKGGIVADVGVKRPVNGIDDGVEVQVLIRRPCNGCEVYSVDVGSINVAVDGFDSDGFLVLQTLMRYENGGEFALPSVCVHGSVGGVEFIGECERGVVKRRGETVSCRKYFEWHGTGEVCKRVDEFTVVPREPVVDCEVQHDEVLYAGKRTVVRFKFVNREDHSVCVSGHGKGVLLKKYDIECGQFESGDIPPGGEATVECVFDVPQVGGLPFVENVEENLVMKFTMDYGGIAIVKEYFVAVCEMFEFQNSVRPVVNGLNGPVYTRRWLFTLRLRNKTKDEVDVQRCRFAVRGPKGVQLSVRPEMDENEEGVIASGEVKIMRVALDVCNNGSGRVLRSVPVDVACDLDLDNGRYSVNVYKGNLPHCEPRVLVTKVGEKEEDNEVIVKYVIENPTERTLQYESDNERIVVKPFSDVSIERRYFDGLDVPLLTFYDSEHDVYLYAVSADNSVRVLDGKLRVIS